MSYNHRLLSEIRKNGWKNKDVIKATNIHQVRFSRIICGLKEATADEKRDIAKFLRIAQKA